MGNLTAPVRPTPYLPASARPTVMSRAGAERHSVSDGIVAALEHQRLTTPFPVEDALAEITAEPSAAETTRMPAQSAPEPAAVTEVMQTAAVTAVFFAGASHSRATDVKARIPTNGIAVSAPRPHARVLFPAIPAPRVPRSMHPGITSTAPPRPSTSSIPPLVPATSPIAARLPLPAPTRTPVPITTPHGRTMFIRPAVPATFSQGSIPPANTQSNIVDTSMRTLGAAGSTPMHAARGERRRYITPRDAFLPPASSAADALTAYGGPPASITPSWFAVGESAFTDSRARRVFPVGPHTQHARERQLAWIYLFAALLMPLLAPIGWVHAEEQTLRFSDRLFRLERLAGLVLTLVSVSVLACALTVLVVRR